MLWVCSWLQPRSSFYYIVYTVQIMLRCGVEWCSFGGVANGVAPRRVGRGLGGNLAGRIKVVEMEEIRA